MDVTGLLGVFSTPDHVIVYLHGDTIDEVRQPFNICFRARLVGGQITPQPSSGA